MNPTLEQIAEKRQECLKALHCLYIAVEKSVAVDVNEKVHAYIAALTEAVQPLQREVEELKKWKDEDPRMLREQIRVADSAYQQLQSRLDQAEKALTLSDNRREELAHENRELVNENMIWKSQLSSAEQDKKRLELLISLKSHHIEEEEPGVFYIMVRNVVLGKGHTLRQAIDSAMERNK